MNCEIVAIGSELLTPFRQDTNSLYLTEHLNRLGVTVTFKTIVGDSQADLVDVIRIALRRANIVILMGGLGPTEDDLTREATAESLGIELHRDEKLLEELRARFAARGFKMTENNAKQADTLAGAQILKNPKGSAPGQYVQIHVKEGMRVVILLPGPPHELTAMFDEQCVDRLLSFVPHRSIAKRVLKVAMVGESALDARIAGIYRPYSKVQTTLLAHGGEVQIHLQTEADDLEDAQKVVDELAGKIEDELDDRVFSAQGESLEEIVNYYLQMRGASLAVAESCTGGLLAQRITNVSGASRSFVGGVVAYSNDLKTELVGVAPLLIVEHGAVSRQVAVAMAEGIRERCRATLGVGITGVAGPGGATETKPVGLVYVAVSGNGDTQVAERRFPGDRERIRWWASQLALDMIRLKLM